MKKTHRGWSDASFVVALGIVATLMFDAVHSAHAQTLYAVGLDDHNLYRVSTANAALTLVGNTGVGLGSLEYRPSDGMLYGFTVGANAALYRVNPANANATL